MRIPKSHLNASGNVKSMRTPPGDPRPLARMEHHPVTKTEDVVIDSELQVRMVVEWPPENLHS